MGSGGWFSGSPPLAIAGDEASRVKLAEWKKKDNCALAQIALTVGNSELVHIKGAKSSNEAWSRFVVPMKLKVSLPKSSSVESCSM